MTQTRQHDQNGNLTSLTYCNGVTTTYTYDALNRLLSRATPSETTVSFTYWPNDAFGNRVSKTVGGVTTQYLVEDDMNPTGYPQVFDELVGGVVTRTYTYGLQRISQDQQISSAWTPSFYGYDGFGSVRQLTNLAGAVTDSYEYDAFGNLLNSTGSTPNVYKYRGEQFDPDLGLYYLRARYYNSLTGRFMSRDPEDGKATDPRTLHKYLYAGGDPVNGRDPMGREEEIEDASETAYREARTIKTAVLFVYDLTCIGYAEITLLDLIYKTTSFSQTKNIVLTTACLLRAVGALAYAE